MHLHRTVCLALLLLTAAALPLLTGCEEADQVGFLPKEAFAEPADFVDLRLVDGNTKFGFNIFRALCEKSPRENIFISPASISMALAMTANGAAGETFRTILKTLQLQDMELIEINRAFADLKSILENPDPEVELAIANSLWSRQGVVLNEEFLQRNQDYFDAEISTLNFNLSDAARTINRWVEKQTRGKIKEIVEDPIDPRTFLFLINALYFYGNWSKEFDVQKTREIPFELPGGNKKKHPVMFQEGTYRYLRGEGFEAVSLPYGENRRVNMTIFLPARESSLASFYRELTPENWADWQLSFKETEGTIGLPRFTVEYEVSLTDILIDLGMECAFDPQSADFSGMRPTPPELFISEVKHKTFVDVHEKGTEAAAVTSVECRVTSVQSDRFSMIIDRPFFFAIVDQKTGAILFMGSVNEP